MDLEHLKQLLDLVRERRRSGGEFDAEAFDVAAVDRGMRGR